MVRIISDASSSIKDHDTWRFFYLRARPVYSLRDRPGYWEGAAASAEDLRRAVDLGWRVAILPERSGLAILDCDVRGRWAEGEDGTVRPVQHRGINDLARLADRCGQPFPVTYTVKSPSGGVHLYFRQHPQYPVKSHGHADAWLIDVKASRNVYAVCPPTLGYELIGDRAAIEMPVWLARYIERGAKRLAAPPPSPGGRVLQESRRGAILSVPARASHEKDHWNNAVYWAASRLLELGEHPDAVRAAVLDAAAPWSECETRRAERTIQSAIERAGGAR